MSKITLTDVTNPEDQTSFSAAINNNNTAIETALDNTLSRDGSTPNQMLADLDMNSHHVINLPAPLTDNEPARRIDLTNATTVGSITKGGTNISGGTTGKILYDNAGKIDEATVGTGLLLSGGILTSTGSSSPVITINTTTTSGGTPNKLLYDNAGTVGEATVGSGLSLSGGTLTATGGGGASGLTVGSSSITSGTTGKLLYDNAGVLGEATIGSGLNLSTGTVTAAVTSVAGKTGAVTLANTDISGLGALATSTDAANLTGTVSVNRFNSGTSASSSTFLRGDGTWVTPAGSTTYTYETVAAFQAATVPTSTAMILRDTSTSIADPVPVEKLVGTPSPVQPWHVQDASSAYFFVRIPRVRPEMPRFGAKRDGTTDDRTAVQNAISYALANNAIVELTGMYALSARVSKPDGTDPGAMMIEGNGFDTTGFTMTGADIPIYCPATGSNRSTGIRLSNFRIDGQNSNSKGVYIVNALNCVIDALHVVRFGGDAFHLDFTAGYGNLRTTIKDCKTSPATNNAQIQANAASVNCVNGNYLTLQNNYFSGYIDGTHYLNYLVYHTTDSCETIANVFESCVNCVYAGGGSYNSLNDKPVGSSISGRHFIIATNNPCSIWYPRGTQKGDIDVTGVSAPNTTVAAYCETQGKVSWP